MRSITISEQQLYTGTCPHSFPRARSSGLSKYIYCDLRVINWCLFRDGLEIEYAVYSQIVHTWTTARRSVDDVVVINFRHKSELTLNVTNEKYWTIKCASADSSTFTYTWDINSCQTVTINEYTSQCSCPQDGIYALLITTFPFKVNYFDYLMHF